MKQIIKLNIKEIKNSNRREANQLAIYKGGRGVELENTEKQILSTFQLSTLFPTVYSNDRNNYFYHTFTTIYYKEA